MKKLFALILAGAMAISMVACSSKGSDNSGDTDSEGKLKVQLIVSNLGDKSFNDSADASLKEMQSEGLIDYTVVEFGNDNSKAEPTMQEAAEDGYDIVCFNNLGFGIATEWLSAHAAEYPDTTFFVYDEPSQVVDADNVYLLAYKANESDYLAGIVAAMESKTGVLGFVGGQQTLVIRDFLVGFVEGARSVNPDIQVKVSYVGVYNDPIKGKDIGNDLILNQKADVIHAVAGSSGNGALEAAADNGVLSIGVDSDQETTLSPELAAVTLTSGLKNVGQSLIWVFDELDAGNEHWGEFVELGINEGGVGIVTDKNFQTLPDAVKDAVTSAEEAVIAGEIDVPTAIGDETNGVVTLRDSMKP